MADLTPDTVPRCCMTDRDSDRHCGRVAAHRVILGCLHEHMLPGYVCTQHIAAVHDRAHITCGLCSKGRDPHECPTVGREVTREEARRLLS